jgi:hypothetical protein
MLSLMNIQKQCESVAKLFTHLDNLEKSYKRFLSTLTDEVEDHQDRGNEVPPKALLLQSQAAELGSRIESSEMFTFDDIETVSVELQYLMGLRDKVFQETRTTPGRIFLVDSSDLDEAIDDLEEFRKDFPADLVKSMQRGLDQTLITLRQLAQSSDDRDALAVAVKTHKLIMGKHPDSWPLRPFVTNLMNGCISLQDAIRSATVKSGAPAKKVGPKEILNALVSFESSMDKGVDLSMTQIVGKIKAAVERARGGMGKTVAGEMDLPVRTKAGTVVQLTFAVKNDFNMRRQLDQNMGREVEGDMTSLVCKGNPETGRPGTKWMAVKKVTFLVND